MKKKMLVGVFSLLILTTASWFISEAVASYRYDMDPANGVDILEGVGAGIALAFGIFAVFYEIDLFYTVYYFSISQKTKTESILNILSNMSLLSMFFYNYYHTYFGGHIADLLILILLLLYIVLRIASFLVSAWLDSKTVTQPFQ